MGEGPLEIHEDQNVESKEKVPFNAEATADAAQVLLNLRLKYPTEIPFAAWKMLRRVEKLLNDELEANVIKPPTEDSVK